MWRGLKCVGVSPNAVMGRVRDLRMNSGLTLFIFTTPMERDFLDTMRGEIGTSGPLGVSRRKVGIPGAPIKPNSHAAAAVLQDRPCTRERERKGSRETRRSFIVVA